MLFHVTIAHEAAQCPGPGLSESVPLPRDAESQTLLWGAACLLFADGEHVAYAVLDAADARRAIEQVSGWVPANWSLRAHAVLALPGQLELVNSVLSLGAPALKVPAPSARVEQRAEVEPPPPAIHAAVPPEPTPAPTPEPEPEPVRTPAQRVSLTDLIKGLDLTPPTGVRTTDHGDDDDLPTEVLTTAPNAPALVPQLRLRAVDGSVDCVVGQTGATLGRLPDNTITLPDDRISGRHASIDFRDGAYWITDLQSRNGTAVNGRRVNGTPHRLADGDEITIGATRLLARLETAERPLSR